MRIDLPDREATNASRCGRDCATCAVRLCQQDKPSEKCDDATMTAAGRSVSPRP